MMTDAILAGAAGAGAAFCISLSLCCVSLLFGITSARHSTARQRTADLALERWCRADPA